MKLTVGMATFRDFHGVYFTLQSIKTHHSEILKNIEFVVVDQAPETKEGIETQKLIKAFAASGAAGAKYIPYTERIGTSASREQIFQNATGEAVMVLDCHVLLVPGALQSVFSYFSWRDGRINNHKNLISGPILTDAIWNYPTHSVLATHYADHWRAEMWGIWGRAWQCSCGGFNFTPVKDEALARFETLTMKPEIVKSCPNCSKPLPGLIGWDPGLEPALLNLGYSDLSDSSAPFDIPGMGLGMFACMKNEWPGFCPDAAGFGGEELYIHEKWRSRGEDYLVQCLPSAKWVHRFPRPEGAAYPNSLWYKCRNYVVEFQEMGWDLTPVYEHFVLGKGSNNQVPQAEWDIMVSDPKKFIHGPTTKHRPPTMINGMPVGVLEATIDDYFIQITKKPRDLNHHFQLLRELGTKVTKITEFSKRKESTITWMTCKPELITTYNLELGDSLLQNAIKIFEGDIKAESKQSSEVEEINECDLLYIDTVHHADRLRGELSKFGGQAKRFIVLRGTGAFGEEAEGGGPGLFEAIREFLTENNEWKVIFHTKNQYGMTVLGKFQEDMPGTEIVPWPPGFGPGTEMKKLTDLLGIKDKPGCSCRALMIQMDRWGVQGCKDNFDEIVAKIKENAQRWNWAEKTMAAANAITSGLAFSLHPMDPYPDLVKLAIKNAEKNESNLLDADV